jgi:hypothetical protein
MCPSNKIKNKQNKKEKKKINIKKEKNTYKCSLLV